MFSQSEYLQIRLRFRLGAGLHLRDLQGGLSVVDLDGLDDLCDLDHDLRGRLVLVRPPQPPTASLGCSDFKEVRLGVRLG